MGDTLCETLITGGGILLVVIPVVWLIHWLRGDTDRKEICIEED